MGQSKPLTGAASVPSLNLETGCQAQKLDAIGQLAGGIAQEFNHLLSVIEAGHQQIARYSDDDRMDRVLEINKIAIDRSRKLVAQLLAYACKQTLKPACTDINATVSVFEVLIGQAIGGGRSVQWHLGRELPPAYVDPAQLQSALVNLVVNARDAIPHAGTIRIFTELKTLPAQNYPPPYNVAAGQYVVLGVRDTGSGMGQAIAQRAVEPFFTTKIAGQGTGLGLSQCYGFARQSGGTLVIDSLPGAGSTIRILLPALALENKTERKTGERNILLIDDDFAIRSLLGEMLRGLGHTVFEAEDAHDALNQLKDNFSIDYLFTDIIMPNGINGLDQMEARSGLPALLESGYPREVLQNIAQLKHDVAFLKQPKPMDRLMAQTNAAEPYPH